MLSKITDMQPRRILIDGTHTHRSGLSHGVQRVVRMLAKNLPEVAEGLATVESVTKKHNGFIATQIETREYWYSDRIRSNVQRHLPSWYLKLARFACDTTGSKTLKKWMLPLPNRQGMFKVPLKILRAVEKFTSAKPAAKPVVPGSGDILILPDAYWSQPDIWPLVQQARSKGAYIVTLVHDIIPLTHPQFVSGSARLTFSEYVRHFATTSDLIVTVSTTVRDILIEQLPRIVTAGQVCRDIQASRNGCELEQPTGRVRAEIRALFEDGNNSPYIMVSSFDPRKNHTYVLDAFEKLWSDGGNHKLCLIGSVGPHCVELLDRISHHPLFNKQLFTLHDANDTELSYCYQRSRAVVFPSIVEGFGLPIVEAQMHGKVVFASDTPVHREVGREGCFYTQLDDFTDLVDQLGQWHDQIGNRMPEPLQYATPTTWRESSQLLLDACLKGYQRWQSSQQQVLGRVA